MGRNKTERRPLTPDEEERAHSLMESYVWLAEGVARRCRRRFAAEHDNRWRLIPLDVAVSVAYLGLCEAAKAYVGLSYNLPESEEKTYLAKCIENALRDYVREERHLSRVKDQAEEDTTAKETVPRVTASVEAIAKRHLASDEEYEEADEDKYLLREVQVDQSLSLLPIDDAFRAFAASLPIEERVVFEEAMVQNRSLEEAAAAAGKRLGYEGGICRTRFYEIRRSVAKKLFAWIDEVYGQHKQYGLAA